MRAPSVLVLLVLAAGVQSQGAAPQGDTYLVRNKPGCEKYLVLSAIDRGNATTHKAIEETIDEWQAVVLMAAFAVFTVLVSLLHKLLRKYVFYDAHLLDTYFDAGADVNAGLVACSVAVKWAWTSSLTWSSDLTKQYGIVGPFVFAAATAGPLFLFAIVLVEIRIKSPGAKTFLQVIRARFGAKPHIVMIVFALFTNLLIAGMVMAEGSVMLSALTDGINKEAMCIILSIVIGIFTTIGGVGGAIYVGYFCCVLLLSIVLYYFTDVFYDPLDRDDNPFGSIDKIYNITRCVNGPKGNEEKSLVSFLSEDGFLEGIAIFLCSFSSVFLNQSFWQMGVSAKPGHGVWGFLSAGLVWFAIPFGAAFALGMGYWAMTLQAGGHLISENDARQGLLPVLTSQLLLEDTGDFVMFTFVLVAVVTTVAGEVLAMSSIILYDIYQTYVAPFDMTLTKEIDGNTTLREKRQQRNEEFLVYNRRCAILRYAVVACTTILLIPDTLIILAIDIDLAWLFRALAIVVGSCVFPVVTAITWHRITGPGMITGVVAGFLTGIGGWLGYASTLDKNLEAFRENTSDSVAVIIGSSVALLVGLIACVFISLLTGGCSGDLMEEEEWEKTRKVDNPVLPWTVRYAPDIGAHQMVKGKPHFYTVRRAFKAAEICAYIFGVLLSVIILLVWPACMLLLDVLSENQFEAWTHVVMLVVCAATAYAAILPLTWEIVQTCRQIYYNRQWANFGKHERLHDDPSELSSRQQGLHSPAPKQSPPETQSFHNLDDMDTSSNQPLGKDNSSTDSNEKDRWKTFIDIDN